MKYGIMTYHNIPNFGAILQAYALCKIVNEFGYECDIIDYECKNIVKRELKYHGAGNAVKRVLHRVFSWPHIEKKVLQCQEFVRLYYSKEKYTIETISKANKKYDGFISGSDMIWNLDVNGYDYSYFLDFAYEGKKKIAYGSSIGDCWKSSDVSKIKHLLDQYEAISVREKDTSCYIKEKFGLPCKWVADPTMLLPVSFWEIYTEPVKEDAYVIVYFPSDYLIEMAKEYCKKHNKKLIVLRVMLPGKRKDSKILYSPNEWLSYLKHADAVFTNSYHGLLFSLYFNKPVWTDNQSNRIQVLLNRLNLDCCNLKNDTACSNVIDYNQCNKLIQSFREDSLAYLKAVL